MGFQRGFVMIKGMQEHVSPVNKLFFADNALEFTIIQRKGHAFPKARGLYVLLHVIFGQLSVAGGALDLDVSFVVGYSILKGQNVFT